MENELFKAVQHKNLDALKILLQSGANPNAKLDVLGQTALISYLGF